MIAALRGTFEGLAGEAALISVGGVVFQVFATRRALAACGEPGSPVSLRTYLHLREDMVALYGFADEEERALFLKLLGVSGVGPRLALAVLSTLGPAELASAVQAGDAAALAAIPGIGKRIGGRIVLELRGKLGGPGAGTPPLTARAALAPVQAALLQLGYSPSEVEQALAAQPPDAASDLETALRSSLRLLSEPMRGRAQ